MIRCRDFLLRFFVSSALDRDGQILSQEFFDAAEISFSPVGEIGF